MRGGGGGHPVTKPIDPACAERQGSSAENDLREAKLLDELHHHPLQSLTMNWAQDSFSPIPTFVDTGATLIDKSNVESFIKARNSATASK
jgi:hypothetical protein